MFHDDPHEPPDPSHKAALLSRLPLSAGRYLLPQGGNFSRQFLQGTFHAARPITARYKCVVFYAVVVSQSPIGISLGGIVFAHGTEYLHGTLRSAQRLQKPAGLGGVSRSFRRGIGRARTVVFDLIPHKFKFRDEFLRVPTDGESVAARS